MSYSGLTDRQLHHVCLCVWGLHWLTYSKFLRFQSPPALLSSLRWLRRYSRQEGVRTGMKTHLVWCAFVSVETEMTDERQWCLNRTEVKLVWIWFGFVNSSLLSVLVSCTSSWHRARSLFGAKLITAQISHSIKELCNDKSYKNIKLNPIDKMLRICSNTETYGIGTMRTQNKIWNDVIRSEGRFSSYVRELVLNSFIFPSTLTSTP